MSEAFAIETSTIGMVLWNPTSEDLDMQYAGISITMKAGQEQAYEISCARHLLNGFGPRGLTSLKYGCTDYEKKRIGEAAIQRNREFKEKQVVEYNQRNENRKQMGLGFNPPTETVKRYARELKLELLQPYSVRDAERSDIEQLRSENAQQKQQFNELLAKFEHVMSRLPKEPAPEPEIPERPKVRPNFKRE